MKRKITIVIINIILFVTVFFILDLFYIFCTNGIYNKIWGNMIFPIILGSIMVTLFWSVFKDSSKALGFCYVIIFIMGVINLIKYNTTNEPFFLSDFLFINKIGSLSKIAFSNISLNVALKFVGVSLGFLTFLILLWLLGKKNNLKLENKKTRIGIILLDIALLIVLFFPTTFLKNFYLKVFFKVDKIKEYETYGTNTLYYEYYGCTTGTYGVHLNRFFVEPDGFDKNIIETEIKDVASKYAKKNLLGKCNVIIVFSESFWDINQLTEIQFNREITSNFNNLKEKGKLVNLISPTYGGLSENVAFEFFTGANMSYFPNGYIPVASLYNKKNSSEIPSLIKAFKKVGYKTTTVFVHDYYKSENAYKKMGMDRYVELISLDDSLKYTDEILSHIIINDLNKKDGLILNFYSTNEGHMPYSIEKYKNYNVSIVRSNLSKTENETLLSYAQGLYNADKQLGNLYKGINTFNEDTLLIFLGDHLPYLNTSDNINVIDKLDFFNTDDILLNYYRKYNTQALILANFDIEDLEIPEVLGTDMLFTYIVNNMDLETHDYYKWLEKYSNDILASNKYITIDSDENIFLTSDLTDELYKKYKYREMIQYNYFIN